MINFWILCRYFAPLNQKKIELHTEFSDLLTHTLDLLANNFKLQDKRLKLSLNGNRKIVGTLRGYDAFLNVVIEDAEGDGGNYLGQLVIRGNSIVQFEALERVN